MAKDIFKNYAFLKALRENDGMTTRQVCEKVSCSYRNTHRYLRNLEAALEQFSSISEDLESK